MMTELEVASRAYVFETARFLVREHPVTTEAAATRPGCLSWDSPGPAGLPSEPIEQNWSWR